LFSLVQRKLKRKYLDGGGGCGDDDDSDDRDGGDGGGEPGAAASGATGKGASISREKARVKQLFIDENAAVQDYLIDFKDKFGSYHDAASGEKMGVDEESISLKAVASKSEESRCEADPKALANDMICPILGAMMKDPVKCFESEVLESRTFTLSIGSYERSAIEQVFDDAQTESRDAIAPLTNGLLKTQRVDGKLQLVLQADEDMCQKIEALREENRSREAKQKHEAEGEEDKKIMLRRMGYILEDFNLKEIEKCAVIGSAQELLCKLGKGHFMCVIGPPASGKTLTMFQVDNSFTIARQLLM